MTLTQPFPGLLLLLAVSACNEPADIPDWLRAKIDTADISPGVPAHAARYQYHGNTVYYLSPVAPDTFGCLFDTDGKTLGCPDGGMTGNGDGTHTDFFHIRTDEKILWQSKK